MFLPPDLQPDELNVLETIDRRGVVRGRDLFRLCGMSRPAELVSPIQTLLKNELIDVTGNARDEKGILSAVFSTRPSADAAVKFTLKRAH